MNECHPKRKRSEWDEEEEGEGEEGAIEEEEEVEEDSALVSLKGDVAVPAEEAVAQLSQSGPWIPSLEGFRQGRMVLELSLPLPLPLPLPWG